MKEKIRFSLFFPPFLYAFPLTFSFWLLNCDEVVCRNEMDKLHATLLVWKIMLPEPLIAGKLDCHLMRKYNIMITMKEIHFLFLAKIRTL